MNLEQVRQLRMAARNKLLDVIPGLPGVLLDEVHALSEAVLTSIVTLGIGRRPGSALEANDFWLTARIRTPLRLPIQELKIRETLMGVAGANFDLQYTGPVKPLGSAPIGAAGNGILNIGASISRKLIRGGSLGFFARSRGDHTRGFVSANHVIANFGNDIPLDVVTPSQTTNRIGQLVRAVPLDGAGAKRSDAAFASLDASVQADRSSLPHGQRFSGTVAPPEESIDVVKAGAATHFTPGIVTSFDNFDFKMPVHRIGFVDFVHQIEIKSADPHRFFAANGDSGSLVVNNLGHAVGLLFAVAGDFTYVNPMQFVLDDLGVDPDVAP